MIDGGIPLPEVRSLLESAAAFIDVWKLGWGSAYLDATLDDKLALLRRHEVIACPGGTLLEVAAYQRRFEEYLEWLAACGFRQVEVSDGLGLLGAEAKATLIRRAAVDFTVVAEVGLKQPTSVLSPATWVELARADLDAGAATVIAEGRGAAPSASTPPMGRCGPTSSTPCSTTSDPSDWCSRRRARTSRRG